MDGIEPANGPHEAPEEAVAAPAQPEEPDDELLEDQADAAEDFLNGLLDVLDLDGEAVAEFEDDTIVVEVTGPDMGLLIGRHGATLDALQELTRAAVQHKTAARARLNLDIDAYRERHRAILERKARTAAARALKERQPVELEPMPSQDRRLVHTALMHYEGIKTTSRGQDPERRVVVVPE